MNNVEWLGAAAKAGRMLTDGRGRKVAERYAERVIACSPYPQDKTRRYMNIALPKRYSVGRDRQGNLQLHCFHVNNEETDDAAVA